MYTYAFFKTPIIALELPPGIVGSLEVASCDRLSALVEPGLAVESLQTNDEQLMQSVVAHDQIICEIFRQTTVLPLRFGTCFLSRDHLLAHLASHYDDYLQKLNQLEGKVEYLLKLTPTEPITDSPAPTATQGRDYFLAKKRLYQTQLEQRQQQTAQLQLVMQAIAQVYPDVALGTPQAGVERMYLLVDRQEEAMLQHHLHTWQAQCSQWQLSLGTAVPPYHFLGDAPTEQ